MNDCMTQEDAMNMNNEQAVSILIPLRDMMRDQHGCPISDAYFALDRAIESLKQLTQPNTPNTLNVNALDTIYRQDAVDAMCKLMGSWFGGDPKDEREEIAWIINHLPSVQPEIVRCKDCKYADDHGVCQNSIGLVIQDDDDFCSRAERR